ncbi:MAG: glutathione S-transferase family protein, partial [Euryarchaeota archaeon]|nr:glutathione S-transferase family protein [Euryarchaeota archaeon]
NHQLDILTSGLKGGFFGGDGPNGADFANYGILRAMENLDGWDIIQNHQAGFAWFNRMQAISKV